SDGTWASYGVETYWGRRPLYQARDAHIAAYAGALEAIDAGVTTVLDFHDCSVRPGNADASLDALEKSGLRAVFCYGLEGPPDLPQAREPTSEELAPTHDWHASEARALRAGRLSSDEARVTMGITTRDFEKLPFACSEHDLALARELDVRTTTHHANGGSRNGKEPYIDGLKRQRMLGEDLVISHGQSFSAEELDTLAEAGVKIAVSAESELAQGADPVTWRARQHGVTVGLGADSVGSLSGDMFRHMQLTLKAARGSRNRLLAADGVAPRDVALTAADMLEMTTMGGAYCLRMETRIGSLKPGKQADIILLRRDRIGMMSGAEPEQIAVLQANGRDVDTVLIGGQILKRHGVLLGVDQPAVALELDTARAALAQAHGAIDFSAYHNAFSR
ncbi:MAG: amidohydrolase family protein, partial [Rhodospirillaceae bacterium]|nr:amidohydrolase family protein [Rhodospirillaceae bacterium]